jgi:hypothetical protein
MADEKQEQGMNPWMMALLIIVCALMALRAYKTWFPDEPEPRSDPAPRRVDFYFHDD